MILFDEVFYDIALLWSVVIAYNWDDELSEPFFGGKN